MAVFFYSCFSISNNSFLSFAMSSNTNLLSFNNFYLRSQPPSASILFSDSFHVSPYKLYDRELFIISSSSTVDLCSNRFADLLVAHPSSVLIKITHLSTNFRDRGDLEQRIRSSEISNYFIGSDFVAVVVAVGASVTSLAVSDRVIPSHTYPDHGLASVTASSGLLLIESDRLVVIPSFIPDSVAASFSVPFQTAFSLVRRSNAASSCSHALVTAPSSATSLAVMQILSGFDIPFTILARNSSSISKLQSLGFDRIIIADPTSPDFDSKLAVAFSNLEFTHVFDNFPDVYAFHLTPFLSFSSKYMFAGLLDQGLYFQDHANSRLLFSQILHRFMMKNVHFIGNCLGSHQDLLSALDLYSDSDLTVSIDSHHDFNHISDFIDSSFASVTRFGKSVLTLNGV